MILESYTAQVSLRRVMIFLQGYGISANLSTKIAKRYGADTIAMIRENPYRLVMDIDGVGFITADRIALSMGVDPQSEFRLRSALYHLLTEAASQFGHTYLAPGYAFAAGVRAAQCRGRPGAKPDHPGAFAAADHSDRCIRAGG